MAQNANELIEDIYWQELEKEGITKDDLDLVDLDIAYKPVIPVRGGEPCDVKITSGGKYWVMHPLLADRPVTADGLKVMRFRYLQFDPERVKIRNKVNHILNT